MLPNMDKGFTGVNACIYIGKSLPHRRPAAAGVLCGGAFGACEQEGAAAGSPAVSARAARRGITGVNACIYIGKPGVTEGTGGMGPAPCSEAVLCPAQCIPFEALSVALLTMLRSGPAPSRSVAHAVCEAHSRPDKPVSLLAGPRLPFNVAAK